MLTYIYMHSMLYGLIGNLYPIQLDGVKVTGDHMLMCVCVCVCVRVHVQGTKRRSEVSHNASNGLSTIYANTTFIDE